MGDADRRIGGVDRLAARPGGAEGIDAQVLCLDLDVDVLGLWQHRDGDRRGMHAALRLGLGNALHAMHPALVLHLRVDAVALDDRDDFFHAAHAALRLGEDFDLPAMLFGEAHIHPEDFRDKQRGLVAASAGANFEYHVLFVVRIFGQQQELEVRPRSSAAAPGVAPALPAPWRACLRRSRPSALGVGDAGLDLLVVAELVDDRLPGRDAAWRSSGIFRGR